MSRSPASTAVEIPDAWRQSSISRFDSCPLSLRFDLALDLPQLPGTIGQLGARGTLFHRFAAAAINHMRAHAEESIGVDQAMELLLRIIAQREIPTPDGDWEPCPAHEVVSLHLDELRWLRVLVTRWTHKHRFHVERVVAVERRLYGDITVRGPGDTEYVRTVSGMPDLLLSGPGRDEATVLDWKSGWAKPSRKRAPADGDEPTTDKLSDMGYVQQVVYGWLVMKNYPSIQKVWEREYYVMENEDPVREAAVERWEIERIEDVLAAVISQMDAAVEAEQEREARVRAGKAKRLKPYTKEWFREHGRWFPIPGTQCGTCVGRRHCPVREHFGIPTTLAEAQDLAREWHVAGEIRAERIPYLKGWVNEHGPVPIAHAKGRRVVGYQNSNSLSLFEPADAPDSPFDPLLEKAAKDAGVLI